jgi:hypothetical protein
MLEKHGDLLPGLPTEYNQAEDCNVPLEREVVTL